MTLGTKGWMLEVGLSVVCLQAPPESGALLQISLMFIGLTMICSLRPCGWRWHHSPPANVKDKYPNIWIVMLRQVLEKGC